MFYGCLSVAVLALLLLLGAGLTFYVGKRVTERLIRIYTDSTPSALEKVELPRAQLEALQQRLDVFKTALDSGKSVELTLTADEINALINQHPDLRGKLFVRIDNDRVTGEVSYPLGDLGPFKLKGRYLNGTATFRVALTQGHFDVHIQDISVKSKPLPAPLTRELQKQNLARDFENDPSVATNVAKFDSVEITNGKVVLRSKGTEKP